ncbi:hypothetical protein BKA61DRAFT_581943 [Leptodontidium sp. MPI-SDFR-AT-0119]|nr:hypothetical protein BKA61DRAFT_581943 [Leptodontidium sp. MPI-SDFR-AT-0119]
MRRKANSSARFYVSKASGLEDMTREELADALLADEGLLPYSVQMHSACRAPYCLRARKGGDQPTCRFFFFPRPLFTDPVVTKEFNHKSWLFSPARNQGILNQCAPAITMCWMANTDIQPYDLTRGVGVYRQDA